MIQKNIQSLLDSSESITAFKQAREQLTKSYRASDGQKKQGFSSPTEALAYVATRMPATYAAVETVLSHVPIETIESVLDLGAGPGTASFAAAFRWPRCKKFHLVEGNRHIYDISQQLIQNVPEIAHQAFDFQHSNLLNYSLDQTYDIAILSYALNELASRDQTHVITNVWEHVEKGVVIVVPGTPEGYRQLMVIREKLIQMGAFIAAPCPHDNACPLIGEDWCHFSVRLPRSSLHQRIKDAPLPYEDEKYSYLVALKDKVERPHARIIKKPIKRSGHITMDLCTRDGLKRQTVSRRNNEIYKQACQQQWGDDWDGHS
jgi:ribosomal protein RSM22 (predicted rRNA methylase)